MEVAYTARQVVSAAYAGKESDAGVGVEGKASSWICAKKKRASETLLALCVDGIPYSRWCVPIAGGLLAGV
jgi:hypothetical protein